MTGKLHPYDITNEHDEWVPQACKKGGPVYIGLQEVNDVAQHSICKIETTKEFGSGFLAEVKLSDSEYMCGLFTNNHVLGRDEDNELYEGCEIHTSFKERYIPITCGSFFVTCPIQDATFIPFPIAHVEDYLKKDLNFAKIYYDVEVGDTIFVLQHPMGGKLSLGIATVTKLTSETITHIVPTDPGSSGSPICNGSGDVVGIHKAAKKNGEENIGAKMDAVVEKIKQRVRKSRKVVQPYLYDSSKRPHNLREIMPKYQRRSFEKHKKNIRRSPTDANIQREFIAIKEIKEDEIEDESFEDIKIAVKKYMKKIGKLVLKIGEKIKEELILDFDNGIYQGRNERGDKGYFRAANVLETISKDEANRMDQEELKAIVIQDYEATSKEELSLFVGKRITDIDRENEAKGWWEGTSGNKRGFFPRAMVELVKGVKEKPRYRKKIPHQRSIDELDEEEETDSDDEDTMDSISEEEPVPLPRNPNLDHQRPRLRSKQSESTDDDGPIANPRSPRDRRASEGNTSHASPYIKRRLFSKNVSLSSVSSDEESPFSKSQEFAVYTIEIQTVDVYHGGTDANVFIELYGDKFSSGKLRLRKTVDNKVDKFERGELDVFEFNLPDLGYISKIRLGHDGSGLFNPDWFVDSVKISCLRVGQRWEFSCNEWIGRKKGDGKLEREFKITEVSDI